MEISNINKINTNVVQGVNDNKRIDNVDTKEKNKLESQITKDGVLLKYGEQQKLVKLEGDANNIKENLENGGELYGLDLLFGILSSGLEGALKGLGVAMLSGLYPLVPAISKYIDSYKKVKEEAQNLGAKNDYEIKKASLKGGLLGSVKGLFHGLLDLAVIGSLTTLSVGLLGSVGFALAPVIGAAYNIAKDDIRMELSKKNKNQITIERKSDNNKDTNNKAEKKLYNLDREPFLPFPPEKPANDTQNPSEKNINKK
ncbi:MAG: hypothetical protein N2485_00990 [bacterium]|nr:hypothetical protein [bacterium]